MSAHLLPSALELLSPALAAEADWVLAARFVGTDAAVQADVRRLGSVGEPALAAAPGRPNRRVLERGRARQSWRARSRCGSACWATGSTRRSTSWPMTSTRDWCRAGAGLGMIRWTGDAPLERLRALRRAAAAREIPMTLERAPWPVRRALGHFGAYREGVGQIVGRLRDTFDPGSA